MRTGDDMGPGCLPSFSLLEPTILIYFGVLISPFLECPVNFVKSESNWGFTSQPCLIARGQIGMRDQKLAGSIRNMQYMKKHVKLRVSFSKNEIPFWFPNQCVHPIIETISFTILFRDPFDAEQHRPYQLFTLSLICCNMLSWLVVSSALKVPIQPQSYSLPYDI